MSHASIFHVNMCEWTKRITKYEEFFAEVAVKKKRQLKVKALQFCKTRKVLSSRQTWKKRKKNLNKIEKVQTKFGYLIQYLEFLTSSKQNNSKWHYLFGEA